MSLFPRAVILKLQFASESPGIFVKTDCCFRLQSFWLSRSGVGVKVYISNELMLLTWQSHCENHCLREKRNLLASEFFHRLSLLLLCIHMFLPGLPNLHSWAHSEGRFTAWALSDDNNHQSCFFLLFLLMKPQVSGATLKCSQLLHCIHAQSKLSDLRKRRQSVEQSHSWLPLVLHTIYPGPSLWPPMAGSLLRPSHLRDGE